MATTTPLPAQPRVALFGAGTVGTAVTILLQRSGCDIVGVWSRSDSSLRRAEQHLQVAGIDLETRFTIDADLVLIGAAGEGIEALAQMLAGRVPASAVAAHLSGATGLSSLAPLIETGVFGLACHPVQACPDIPTAIERLPGSAWGVTATEEIEGWAHALVSQKLHGVGVSVPEEQRGVWHAASVMTSNGIAALLAVGESMLNSIGIAEPVEVLGPLAAGTVDNARSGGGGGRTLTGPVVRGETTTLELHLEGLKAHAPHLLEDYLRIAGSILRAAQDAGRIDERTASEIRDLLK